MRESDAAIDSPFYDHEQELARDRESRADDWGADSVFASHPRRRFGRPVGTSGEDPVRRHAGSWSSRPTHFERRVSGPAPAPLDERAIAAAPLDERATGTDRLPAAPQLTEGIAWSDEPDVTAHLVTVTESAHVPEPSGRRTVVVTGRPGRAALPARAPTPDRRRPRPRAGERLGARPDRVAAWAFGLGMLLILVAVGTADATPL